MAGNTRYGIDIVGTKPLAQRASWSAASGGSAIGDDTWPGEVADDTAILDSSSGTGILEIDAPLANPLAALQMAGATEYGGTLKVTNAFSTEAAVFASTITGSQDITVTGIAISAGAVGDWSGYLGSIIVANTTSLLMQNVTPSSVFGRLDIQNSDTATFVPSGTEPLSIEGDFIFTSGLFDGDSFGMNVAGDISAANGTSWANSGTVTQTVSGDVGLLDADPIVEHIRLGMSGITSTLVGGNCNALTVTVGTGTVTGSIATRMLFVGGQTPNDFWTEDASSTITLGTIRLFAFGQSPTNTSSLTFENCTVGLNIHPHATQTITLNGAVNGGEKALRIYSFTAGIATGAFGDNLTCGDILLGNGATKSGVLDLGSGTHTVGDIERDDGGDATSGINLGTCVLNLRAGATLKGDGLVGTNTSGIIKGGTVENFEPDDVVNCYGTTDGLNNNGNVIFHVSTGGGNRMMMGVG